MSAAAHNPSFAAKAGIPQSVAQEFHAADRGKFGALTAAGKPKKPKGAAMSFGSLARPV